MSTRMSVLSSALLALVALTAAGLIGLGVGVGFAGEGRFDDNGRPSGAPQDEPFFKDAFEWVGGTVCGTRTTRSTAVPGLRFTEGACETSPDSCHYLWKLSFPNGGSAEDHGVCNPETVDRDPVCSGMHKLFPDLCPGGGGTDPSGGSGDSGGTNPPGGSSGDRPGTNPSGGPGGNGGGTNPPTGPAPGGGNVSFGAWGASTWTPAARPAPPVRPLWLGRSNTGWSQPQPTRGNASRRWW